MRVTQDKKPTFDPITITLETYEEAEAFKLMANVAGGVSDAVARETISHTITERRRDAITNILRELWQTQTFQNLKIKEGN